jgi:hypothetical protein
MHGIPEETPSSIDFGERSMYNSTTETEAPVNSLFKTNTCRLLSKQRCAAELDT